MTTCRPLRVLHWITGLQTGGAEMMLLKLLGAWNPRELECRVVSLTERGTMGPRMEALGVPVRALGLPPGSLSGRGLFRYLRTVVDDWVPDLHQGWMHHGDMAATCATLLRGNREPVLWNVRHSLHDLALEPRRKRLVLLMSRGFSRLPARILCNSGVSIRQHKAYGFAGSWSLIPNGFDLDRFRPDLATRAALRLKWAIPADMPLVVHLARFHPVKDHRGMIAALGLLARRRHAFQVVLAGRGVDAGNHDLATWIREAGLEARCRLLGERLDTERVLAASDLLVQSSTSEAFPNALGEALACGIPAVATDVGDSAFVVGEAGRIVPPRDPEALAAALGHLLDDPAERRRLGTLGRTRVVRDFSIRAVASQYLEIYRSLKGS